MSRDCVVIPFRQPEAVGDPLTEVARDGGRRMLALLFAFQHVKPPEKKNWSKQNPEK